MLACVWVGSFCRADEPANATADGEKLQGTWKPVAAELAGKPFPDELLKTMKLVIAEGKYSVTVGEAVDEGVLKLDQKKKPRAIDIVGTKGPNQGKTFPARHQAIPGRVQTGEPLTGWAVSVAHPFPGLAALWPEQVALLDDVFVQGRRSQGEETLHLVKGFDVPPGVPQNVEVHQGCFLRHWGQRHCLFAMVTSFFVLAGFLEIPSKIAVQG
jgi:uncharacterized protein (TIGR03067 family)